MAKRKRKMNPLLVVGGIAVAGLVLYKVLSPPTIKTTIPATTAPPPPITSGNTTSSVITALPSIIDSLNKLFKGSSGSSSNTSSWAGDYTTSPPNMYIAGRRKRVFVY